MSKGVNYLSVEKISKRFGDKLIFEDLTFGINKGRKVALVARNGTGKSTLFRILAGEDTADEGRVVFNNEIKISYLAQDHGLDVNATILDNLFSADNDMVRAIRQYELVLAHGGDDHEELQRATDEMDRHSAWNYESTAKQILGMLDLHDLSREIHSMSGGEKRRVALARVLIEQPDFLLLDEPTNHLDLEMIEWLEDYLEKTAMTLLMVTHDRYFLEVVCDEILELDEGILYRYKGNFSYFLEKKAEREELQMANREKARNLMRRELVWIRTQPKARTTKSKYRQEQFTEVKQNATVKLEDDEMHIQLNPHRLGGKILELHKISKAYGDKILLNKFEYVFKRKESVGVVGPNGSGKSSLLDLITGKDQPDAGKVIVGETVVFGYYTQSGISFKDEQRVIEAVRDIAEIIPLKGGAKITAAQLLERFLFPRSMHHQYISKLSGGERKRLYLLCILMKNPNFLILDEPTNDLDIFTLSVLEDYLNDFPGCLIVVSHDRYFMDKLVEHVLVFEGQGIIKDIPGNYSAFRSKRISEEREAKKLVAPKQQETIVPSSRQQNKMGFKEKYEFNQLTKDLEELESKKLVLEGKLANPDLDHEQIHEISAELGTLMDELGDKEMRWLELSEM
jgi:ABC transport system ATP-binding/permease protein